MSEAQPIEVILLEGLNDTAALTLAVRGWAECVDRGFGDGTMNVHASLNAFVAYVKIGHDRTPVGVMTWDYDATMKRIWIYQSFVEPEMRGHGIYRAMFDQLVKHSIEVLKARSIQSGTHVKNVAMRSVAARLGRFEECVTLRTNLPG